MPDERLANSLKAKVVYR